MLQVQGQIEEGEESRCADMALPKEPLFILRPSVTMGAAERGCAVAKISLWLEVELGKNLAWGWELVFNIPASSIQGVLKTRK